MPPQTRSAFVAGEALALGALLVARLRLSGGRALFGPADRTIVIEPPRMDAGVSGGAGGA